MKTFKIYRAIFAESIEDIDYDNLGQSFAQDASLVEDFARGRDRVSTLENYFVIEAEVTAENIDIAQTNGQWLGEYANEGEVVLESNQEIKVRVFQDDEEILIRVANTGFRRDVNDETRSLPVDCEVSEITDYLNEFSTI